MPRELGAVRQIQFGLEVFAVRLDRLRTEFKSGRDLTRRHPGADLLEDFEFTIRESVDRAMILKAIDANRTSQHAFSHTRAQIVLAAENFTNSFDQLSGRFRLIHVSIGTRSQDSLRVECLVVHGDDEDFNVRELSIDLLADFEAVAALERKIEQHQVGACLPNHLDRLSGISGFASKIHVRLVRDEPRIAIPHNGVVINDENGLASDCRRRHVLRRDRRDGQGILPGFVPAGESALEPAYLLTYVVKRTSSTRPVPRARPGKYPKWHVCVER